MTTALPLYEGKMGHIFDHRFASFFGTGDTDLSPNQDHSPGHSILPRYWIDPETTKDRQHRRDWGTRSAMLGFRRVARNTDERTCISAILPWGAASYGWILTSGPSAPELAFLCAQYNSHIFDYILRQFLTQPSIPQSTFQQIPTVPRSVAEAADFGDGPVFQRVVEMSVRLSATDIKLSEWAAECGCHDAPYNWSLDDRFETSVELDATFLRLYGIERTDASYVLDTFPLIKRKDEAEFGEYRTKRLILEAYDRMGGN